MPFSLFRPRQSKSLGIVALFEKIYDGEPILTVFQIIFFPDLGTNPYFRGINKIVWV
jgi:hypothetical protein